MKDIVLKKIPIEDCHLLKAALANFKKVTQNSKEVQDLMNYSIADVLFYDLERITNRRNPPERTKLKYPLYKAANLYMAIVIYRDEFAFELDALQSTRIQQYHDKIYRQIINNI